MSRLLFFCAAVGAASLLLFLSRAQAATIASDSAADAAYNDSWQPGDNGGSGWGGGWSFRNQGNTVMTTTNGSRGWFTGSSLGNNNPSGSDSNGDGDINSPVVNRAWGVYSNATDQVYAIRPFSGSLQVGHTVKWDMDNGNINSGQVVGLRFLSNATDVNSRVFEARFVGGDSFYTTVGNPNQTSTIGFSREGLHLEYTLTSASTYSLKIVRKENGSTQTMTGTNVNASSIVALAFKNQFAGNGGAFDGFLNNISIMSPNVAPTVADAVINNLNASDPGMVMHTFTANDPDMDPLTWGSFQFGTYTAAYGGGAPNGPQPPGSNAATFNPADQKFNWNTVGSPRGIYTWKVTASDGQGGSDEGTLTVHVTEVPEPSTLGLTSLMLAGLAGLARRRVLRRF